MKTPLVSWETFWSVSGAQDAAPGLLADLLMAWSEPRRHYHTLQHLGECMLHLESCWSLAEHPEEICLALWFHDAVYNPHSRENELYSAAWADKAMSEAGFAPDAIERVCEMILATTHQNAFAQGDCALMLDIDLAILGADKRRFAEYEAQVRIEYEWIEEAAYRASRSKLLNRFLERPRIYHSAFFHSALENKARHNLKEACLKLETPIVIQQRA